MTLEEIRKNDLFYEDVASNIRGYLKQPCFVHNFDMEPVGVVRENGDLVLFLDNKRADPELSERGTFLACHFKDEEASSPYKVVSGLSIPA